MNRATLELFAPLDRSAPEPLRAQLEDAICAAITGGGAPPGTRLPASRVLAEALHVSRGVVSEAYAQIAAEGWIEIRRGAAPIVRAVPAAGIGPYGGPQPAIIKGSDPSTLCSHENPCSEQDRTVRGLTPERCAAGPDGDRAGSERVSAAGVVGGAAAGCWPRCRTPRSTTATRGGTTSCGPSWPRTWCGCAGWSAAPERSGGHQRLHAGAVADVPGAEGARGDAGRGRGPVAGRLVGDDPLGRAGGRRACRSTSTGVRLDALDADAVLVTPAHQFPTGAVLAPERRRALLAWGGIVIEDDYDSEYRYDRAPVGTLQRLAPDRVVYLGTTSKTLAPALRLGWLVAPPALAARDRARALGGRLRRPRDQRPRLRPAARHRRGRPPPAPHPPRVPRAPRPRWSRRSRQRLPTAASPGSPPACTCCCGSRPGRTRRRSWRALAERRIRIRGLAGYRLDAAARATRRSCRLRPAAAAPRSTRSSISWPAACVRP